MASLIVEILVYAAIEVLLWIALFILWAVLFPIACIIMTPMFLLLAVFSTEPFREAITDYYSRLLDFWLYIGPQIRRWHSR